MWESFSGAAASPAVRAAYRQLYPGIYLAKGDSGGAGGAGEGEDMDGDRATSLGDLSVEALGALGEIAGRFNRDDKVNIRKGGGLATGSGSGSRGGRGGGGTGGWGDGGRGGRGRGRGRGGHGEGTGVTGVRESVSSGGERATTHGGRDNRDEKGEDTSGRAGGGVITVGSSPQNRFADIRREEEGGETMEARSARSKAAFEGRVRRQQQVNRLDVDVYRL